MPKDTLDNHNEPAMKPLGTSAPTQPQSNTEPTAGEPCASATKLPAAAAPKEIGGRDGPDPTRYGDWEKAGRCIDF